MRSGLLLIGAGAAAAAIYYATRKKEQVGQAAIQTGDAWANWIGLNKGEARQEAEEAPGVISTWVDEISAKVQDMFQPRGIRNNNPFNLKLTGIPWKGKVPAAKNTDGVFEQFDTPLNGIRAGARDIHNDYWIKGKKTIRALISEFAPVSENNTSAYMQSVASYLGKGVDQTLVFPADLFKLTKAIIGHENGAAYRDHYPDDLIRKAIREAAGS